MKRDKRPLYPISNNNIIFSISHNNNIFSSSLSISSTSLSHHHSNIKMRYSKIIVFALAASTELASAHPTVLMNADGLMARANLEPAAVPRFIHPDGAEAYGKTDLILMPSGHVISKRDPGWADTQHEAAYKYCSVAMAAAHLCLKATGHEAAANAAGALGVGSAFMAASVT